MWCGLTNTTNIEMCSRCGFDIERVSSFSVTVPSGKQDVKNIDLDMQSVLLQQNNQTRIRVSHTLVHLSF